MSLVFLDKNQQTISFVPIDKNVFECVQTKEITKEKTELMQDVINATLKFDKELSEKAHYVGLAETDGSFSLYRIINSSDENDKWSLIGVHFAPDELSGYVVKDIRPNNETVQSVATRLLEGTDWRVGHVDGGLKRVSGSFYYISVRDALKDLQSFGCEILFKATITGEGIIDKWIEIYKQIGEESNERFVHGKNATVVREVKRQDICTSIIGRGRGEEVGDGYGRRIEFADVVWSKAKGDPLDKPKGRNWLEMPEATKLYGIPSKTGKLLKREKVFIFEDIEDPKELLEATYETLLEYSRPLVQFKTTVTTADDIGNTVTVHHNEKGYHYKTRIFKVVYDRVKKTAQADFGDNLGSGLTSQQASIQRGINNLEENKLSFYDSTEVSKYQSDIIRGAKGGSILLMNPEDTGQGTSREPYQMVWMNGPNIDESDHFLVANSEGIGFIDGDFNLDNFKTAWTIDGVFNANFIKAGVLRGVKIQAISQNFMIELFNGAMKYMDLKNNAEIGRIFASYRSGELSGYTMTQRPGYHLGISTGYKGEEGSQVVFEIPKESHGENLLWNLFGKGTIVGDVDISKRLDVKELYVNGIKIDTNGGGQGGGGWNGQYPPEVTTQADKFAWQLWMTLLVYGYSKASIAGILGNVQGEVGPSMNPDTEQSGGPAYGCVQWDGSAYPLVGPTTWNGRQYVQTLMKAAKINDSYVTMVAQGKLIEWCMHNGQWIGAVSPTTVSGFKAETSPANAARAFELNFERPAAAHPERQGWAVDWYNKFKDLKPPTSSGEFIVPIDKPVIVTSEFGWRESPTGGGQELHNAIDLVNNNPQAPIYASSEGTVVFSAGGWNDGYGEYIIIQHKPDLFTGYAHNAQRFVSVGDNVSKGQRIATMGATGNVTGIHTHFQFMEGTNMWSGHVNPRKYIDF